MTKNTKKAVWASALSILMCLSLLIGTTFAWFTDTASTSVNKVQAGTLDVELQYEKTAGAWENAEGKTLQFKVNGQIPTEGTKILWEPGCTYELPALRVANKGNLALKYKLVITGIKGDAKLNEAIVWTMNDVALLNEYNGTMIPGVNGDVTEEMVIKGHMKEEAGNEYQGLSIDGVSVTVYATQLSHEQDSNGNGYDDNVDYNQRSATIMDNANGKTYTLEIGKTYTIGNGTVTVAANGDLTYANSGAAQSVTITTKGGKLTIDAPNDTVYHYGESDFVDVNAIAGNSYHEFGKVGVLAITEGRAIIQNGNNVATTQVLGSSAIIAVPVNVVLETKLEKADSVTEIRLNVIDADGESIEDKAVETANGKTEEVIPEEWKEVLSNDAATIEEAKDYVAVDNNKNYYASLQEAVAAGGTIKLLGNVSLSETLVIEKNVTINMNGFEIVGKGVRAIQVKENTLKLDGNGTVSSTVANVGSSVIRVGDNNATKNAKLYVKVGVTVNAETAYGITAFGNRNEYVHVYGTVTSTAPENSDFDGCAISTLGNDTTKSYVYINDGATVTAANTNAVYMPSGTLYVYDGATVTGRTAIYVKSGSTTIKGGTITGNGAAVAYNYYGNGGKSTGDALVIDSCGYPNGEPSVTVSGGAFTSVNAKAVASYNTEGNALVTGFITDGTFSSDPTEYIPFNYKAVKEGDVWSVSKYDSTAEKPYHIQDEADWLALASQAYYSSGTKNQYYVVDKDLDLTGTSKKAGLRYFAGYIDFGGHKITGLNGSNTYTDRYPSLIKIVKAGSTIKNLKYELPNLGTDYTVKPIGSIEGTGTVTLENISIYGNLNMTDNNTGLLVDFIGGNSKFDGIVNLIGCKSYCNMINNGYSSAFIGGIYRYDGNSKDGNQIVLNAKDCVNYGKILSTGAQASMLISNGTRHDGDNLTLNIENCKNEGQIIAAPGKSAYLAMPDVGNESAFYTKEEIKAFETSGAIVNANGGISASLNAGKLAVTDGKFNLTASIEKVPGATRFVLTFGFQGTGGLGGGGVTQYAFSFENVDAVVNVPAYSWVNAKDATGALTAHNEFGTTYYTDEAGHYVYNQPGYYMNGQPEVSFVAYDADGNIMLVDFYNYAD